MDLDDLLRRQDGVVSRDQARACGLSADALWRRVRNSGWQQPYPRVYLVAGHRLTPLGRIRAAHLHAGRDAVVSGAAAAHLHGDLARAPGVVEVTVPRSAGVRPRPGLRVRRRDLGPEDRSVARGIPVVARPLACLEVAIVRPDGPTLLDRALQDGVTPEGLYAAYCRMLGRPGAARAARLVAAASDGAASAAERLLLAALRTAGIGGWVLGLGCGPWSIDVAFPAARLAVEIDGWAFHSDVTRFRRDRAKQNALVAAGWTVLRFTWHDLDRDPDRAVRSIRGVIATAVRDAAGSAAPRTRAAITPGGSGMMPP